MRKLIYRGKISIGITIRLHSFWIGYYYSPYNRRICINPIPFFTIWIVKPNGKSPIEKSKLS